MYASPSGSSSEKSSEGGREKPTESLVRAERISWMIESEEGAVLDVGEVGEGSSLSATSAR